MDDTRNILAGELKAAIVAAMEKDPTIQRCLERGRKQGYQMHLMAVEIGFAERLKDEELAMVRASKAQDFSNNDKRFMKSLRIAAYDSESEIE